MSSEASARVVSKLIILLCLIFTLCQLGSEFKSGCIAQKFLDGRLPKEEASAINEVILGLSPQSYMWGDFSCNESRNPISCNCSSNTNICHITGVSLRSSGLTGVISEEVGSLTHLEWLDLSSNQLTGSIPASLGNLSTLYMLDLSGNQLTGSIPESLGNLKFGVWKLEKKSHVNFILYLSSNQLSGSIPSTLGNVAGSSVISDPDNYRLFKLKQYDKLSNDSYFGIDLSNNQLTGPIPDSLGNLTFATSLYLNGNFLNGSISASLGALKYLSILYLNNNEISGSLPQTLGNLTRLRYFWVASNRITGIVPKSFASLTNMTGFSVAGNQLSGSFPDFIANWTSITQLYLSGNNFHGNIPVGIFNLSSLQYLEISDVEGSQFQFPPSAKLIGNFKILTLRNCSISGQIPAYIGDMSNQGMLDLSFNSLTGRIPDSLKKINLAYMSFSNNMLTGAVPDWIFNQNGMDLSYNNFSNLTFKPSSKPVVNLFACCCNSSTCVPNTYDHILTDPTRIREKYCPQGKPKYHSLFINCGGGEINMDKNVYEKDNDRSPFYLSPKGNWARSSDGNTIYSMRSCGLSSEAVLYDKARSSPVSLKYYGFCLRKGKYSVTLHFADIGAAQDKNYSTVKRVFDVYIQGERKLKDFNIIDKAGGLNKVHKENFTAVRVNNTLEIHFYLTGGSIFDPYGGFKEDHGPLISAISVTPDLKIRHEKLRLLRIRLISGAGLGSGLGVLLLLIGVRWAHKAMKKRKIIKRRQMFFKRNGGLLLEQQISSGKVNVEKIKLFNSKELEKCTDNFNIDRVLGQGGQGTVFKGMLADGNIVAVKKSKVDDKGKVSEFINEVIILSQINHRNIVRLLGCCLETEVPLLVYEFIPNGTLSQYICEPNEEFPLTWKMRLQIAIEISGALHYLHAAASCPIYHRDIKSTNILLDEKYRAKIADFGTSRTVAIDQTHYTTNVHGTFGYMDPEYFQSSQFTEKSDVYSFGVVLVELLTGKKPISAVTRSTEEEQEQEYRSLATYFIVSMQEDRLFNILDARVANEASKEDIMIVANLARRCLNLNGRNRPTMREVITELEAIKMSNRTHHQGAEFIPEHYPIQQCDDVVSSSRGSTWDSGPTSSSLEFPQSSM